MKTTGTKAEIAKIEEEKIEAFGKEFTDLCEKHGIKAICIGTREQSDNFDDDKTSYMCAAFVRAEFTKPTIEEAKAIKTAYDEADSSISRVMFGAMMSDFVNWPCNCENCKKRNEGIKYSQDGDKICATFADFVNLAESPAGFGDTEEEAKADLLKNYREEKIKSV